ncbi:MAG: UDP-N-acetylglucosamine 1-carboxyvinyltransferase [Alphaproteobacteria bacterium]|jgi:UDP-N-acetylglucosamine 1-carboxyvinyltransferase|nr:UDP-N-acetylglucosamine 1-carboxyvinyltransferase [Alphaproteobacteria bacterium]
MTERTLTITGGQPIKGELTCLGAKNFATKAMVATTLGTSPSTLTNVPPIGDVDITRALLVGAGVDCSPHTDTMTFDPAGMTSSTLTMPDSRNNRIPILLLPTLLHKFGEAHIPVLGGCKIGNRNVDYHLEAARKFGATVWQDETGYHAKSDGRLEGAHVKLPYPSVGATETALFLSVLAEGTSVISNAAIEPEIVELVTMLRAMGAIIFMEEGREIRVEGVEKLTGTQMPILGDRIEVGSWAALACAADGEITVHGIRANTMSNFLSYFRKVGGGFDLIGQDTIKFYRERPLTSITLETDVFPGFSTDWQQPFAVMLTQAEGISVIHETVYESRFGYTEALKGLGADVQLTTHCLGKPCRFENHDYPHSALIKGKVNLKATEDLLEIPDLRAGLAYVIAAAVAEGDTTLTNIDMLERGYGPVKERLEAIGVKAVESTLMQKSA